MVTRFNCFISIEHCLCLCHSCCVPCYLKVSPKKYPCLVHGYVYDVHMSIYIWYFMRMMNSTFIWNLDRFVYVYRKDLYLVDQYRYSVHVCLFVWLMAAYASLYAYLYISWLRGNRSCISTSIRSLWLCVNGLCLCMNVLFPSLSPFWCCRSGSFHASSWIGHRLLAILWDTAALSARSPTSPGCPVIDLVTSLHPSTRSCSTSP